MSCRLPLTRPTLSCTASVDRGSVVPCVTHLVTVHGRYRHGGRRPVLYFPRLTIIVNPGHPDSVLTATLTSHSSNFEVERLDACVSVHGRLGATNCQMSAYLHRVAI